MPTQLLTGCSDAVVPDQSWPRVTQYPLIVQAPAYIGCARGATHFTPVDGHANTFIGITVAWLLYTTRGDPTAARFFVGDHWLFRTDPDFDRVQRNTLAASAVLVRRAPGAGWDAVLAAERSGEVAGVGVAGAAAHLGHR